MISAWTNNRQLAATDFVVATDDVDPAAKAGGGRGFAQQADDGRAGLQQRSLARARDAWRWLIS